jgi:hypothetical protein
MQDFRGLAFFGMGEPRFNGSSLNKLTPPMMHRFSG